MKSKLSKIIICAIFVILILLMLQNNVRAMVDGYYTKADIKWNSGKDNGEDDDADTDNSDGGWITVNGHGNFYCRNHGYNLTGKLLREPVDNPAQWSSGWVEHTVFDDQLKGFKRTKNELIKVNNRVLKLTFGSKVTVTDTLEAAFYAFADEYGKNPSKYVQSSLWYFLNKHPQYISGESSKPGNETTLNEAAEYYTNEWIPNNKADLKTSNKNAKVRISGKDYIAGPFTVEYNEKEYHDREVDIIFSELIGHKIKDQNNKEIPLAQITNSDGTKEYKSIPNGEPFYIKFPYSDTITKLNIEDGVKYIDTVEAYKEDVKTEAYTAKYEWTDNTQTRDLYITKYQHASGCINGGGEPSDNSSCSTCNKYPVQIKVGTEKSGSTTGRLKFTKLNTAYQNMRRFEGKVNYKTDPINLSVPIIPPDTPQPNPEEMDLAGYVWEDMPEGKDQTVNGIKDGRDKVLAGIEVRLYDVTTGKLAKVYKSSNPTLTDSKGHYEFKGLDPTHKYYVKFTYDGILYTNTYGGGVPEYNTPAWNASSKGSELVSGRDALNRRFVTISSYPASYKVPKAIFGDANTYLTGGYNKIFSITDIQNGTGIVAEYKNKITDQLNSYLKSHKRLEDGDQNYFDNVYWPIIRSSSNQTEAKQVLQYIWDCRIDAIAGNESERDGTTKQPKVGLKLYPVYDKFALTDDKGNRITANDSKTTYNGYRIIYNGQLHINLGLIKRPTTDLELTKDLYRAVVSINGQDETYNFGTFDKKGLKINASDAQIKQSVATADYNYAEYARDRLAENTQILPGEGQAVYPENYAPIQMYITYRINVKNNSSMPTSVNEIVSYIDTNYYSYSNSYKTTGGKTLTGITGSFLYPTEQNNEGVSVRAEKPLSDYSGNKFGLRVNEHSKYGTGSETGGNLGIGKELFISFDNDIILENNQMIAVYITYRLGENSTSHSKFNCTYNNPNKSADRANHAYAILQDSLAKGDESKRLTIYTRAEINAYSTFFRKGADPDATQGKYSYPYTSAVNSGQLYRAAGVFDAVSIPGNLDAEQLKIFNEQNNKKIEDDWDRASAFVIVDPNATRTIKGNVWETVNQPANYWLENQNAYPKYDGSNGAGNITAELIEIKDGIEYVRAKTKTNSDGSYNFTEYIPGQYVVRFIYGDTANYETKEQYSPYTTFELNDYQYPCAYNGEFYQSGKANPDTNKNDDNHKNYNQYWYANDKDTRYSDAYDEAKRRIEVNNLLNTYKYSDVLSLIKHPTDYMVYAYTSPLDVEIEYAKEETTAQNPAYTIENIDFALTPRTESKLEINKEVTHLKLVLQNGTVQFDADTKDIRDQKVPAVVQAAQGHDINISMSSELVNGATLEITYTITITNIGPKDTITYYTDVHVSPDNVSQLQEHAIALSFYEEDWAKLVYYEGKMRKHEIATDSFEQKDRPPYKWEDKLVSGKTTTLEYNTNNKATIETTTRAVTVADYVSKNLNFTKQSYTGAIINEAWDLVTMSKEDFDKEYYRQKQNDSLEESLQPITGKSSQNKEERERNSLEIDASEVYDSNMIVLSNPEKNKLVKTDLKSRESVSEEIVLSKVISVNNDSTDTKSYNNNVRIVEINNKVSRVQDMNAANMKYTSARVIVSDPTGIGNKYLPIILTLVVVTIIGSGIILIKKFAIKK